MNHLDSPTPRRLRFEPTSPTPAATHDTSLDRPSGRLPGRSRGRPGRPLCSRAPGRAWALAGLVIAVLGCGPLAPQAEHEQAASGAEDPVAVIIEGDTLRISDVDAYMQESFLEELMRQPEEEIFEAREKAIRELVQKRIIDAEAEARGLTDEQLFEQITGAAPEPSDEDVATWYAENAARLRGASLEDIAPRIRELLAQERKREAWQAFLGPRLEALSYEMKLSPPRKEIEPTHLVRGPAEAPITIMAFSDYQCPYCIRSEPVLAELRTRYPAEVRVIHRHFPLDGIHPQARPASEAAMCADEQGRFWDYHDAIFARRGRLEEASFLEIGGELGLDLEAFTRCVKEGRHAAFVQADLEAGRAAGVTGTPAFFINGIPVKGARDADELSKIVDEELVRMELQ